MTWLAFIIAGSPTTWAADTSAIRFRLTAEPSTLDWNLARTSHETHIIMNIMEGLVEEGPGLKPQPALAEKWEISDGGKIYTFTIRKGVHWSDGRALKASDFVDSWIRLLDPKTKSSYASFLFDVDGAEAFHSGKLKDPSRVGIQALGEDRLQIRLSRVVPYFLHLPTFWVTFPIRLDLIKKNGAKWTEPGNIATLGPYLLSGWDKGKALHLTRNGSYHGSAPSVAKVDAVIEPDDRKARELFESGQTDFFLDATTEDLLKASETGKGQHARVAQYPYLATYYLGFNVNEGPLKDAKIRKALALAIDVPSIPPALQGGQIAATGWIPPGMEGHHPDFKLSGGLYEARGALAKAGYVEGKGFPRLEFWVEKFDRASTLAKVLAANLHDRLGVEVNPHIGTAAEFQKAMKEDRAAIFVGHWGADFPDPANFYEVFSSASGTNYTRWSSPDYDQYLSIAQNTLDGASRLAAFTNAEKILIDRDTAILPLFYKQNAVLLGPRVADFSISPLNYLFLSRVRLK